MTGKFLSATAGLALAIASPASAETVAEFYKGKTLNIYSGHSDGGAYSAYARLVTQHISKHIPGSPTTVFRLKPGASGLVLAHWLNAAAPKDGLHFGTFHERISIEPMIAPQGIKFDGRDFTWIVAMATNASVCFTFAGTGLKTIDDLKKQDVVSGASGATATDAVMARLMNATLGTRLKIINGYRGADILLALERGEVQARCGFGYPSLKTTRPDWLRDKKINIIALLSSRKHPEIPDVPLLMDIVRPEHKDAVRLAGATDEISRPFAAPPRIPADRAMALRKAFRTMFKDKALMADAKKQNLELDPTFGEEISEILDKLYKTPKSVAAQVVKFRTPGADETKIERKRKK